MFTYFLFSLFLAFISSFFSSGFLLLFISLCFFHLVLQSSSAPLLSRFLFPMLTGIKYKLVAGHSGAHPTFPALRRWRHES